MIEEIKKIKEVFNKKDIICGAMKGFTFSLFSYVFILIFGIVFIAITKAPANLITHASTMIFLYLTLNHYMSNITKYFESKKIKVGVLIVLLIAILCSLFTILCVIGFTDTFKFISDGLPRNITPTNNDSF